MPSGEHVPQHLVDERDGVGAAEQTVERAVLEHDHDYVIKRIAAVRSRHDRTIAPFRLGRNVPGTVPP